MSLPIVDFTKMRLGSRPNGGEKIIRCSKCGRKGQFSIYTKGGAVVKHKAKQSAFGLLVTEHCYDKEFSANLTTTTETT